MIEAGDPDMRAPLEFAFLVAALGARQRPPITPPASLRGLMRYQRPPATALVTVFAALDTDQSFRDRVAEAADEESVGPVGLLWLRRPRGWETAIAQARGVSVAVPPSRAAAGTDESKLVPLQKAMREAKAALAASRAETASLQRRLNDAEASVSKAERTRVGMQEEIAGLRTKLQRAEHARQAVAPTLAATVSASVSAEKTVAAAQRKVPSGKTEAAKHTNRLDGMQTQATMAASLVVQPNFDSAALAADLVLAERARDALALALASMSRTIEQAGLIPVVEGAPTAAGGVLATRAGQAVRRRRHHVRLPGGVLASSMEAARFLLGRRDVVHLIDGYNVAKLAFPGISLAEQRDRLLDVVDSVHARFGTDIIVMFDGADVGPVRAARRSVSVQFSPAGLLADDLMVLWLTAAPLEQAVTVVTTDGAVRDACEKLGAHLVHSATFLAAADRRV
jgi:predicted RNA-binding protein with PIN domain